MVSVPRHCSSSSAIVVFVFLLLLSLSILSFLYSTHHDPSKSITTTTDPQGNRIEHPMRHPPPSPLPSVIPVAARPPSQYHPPTKRPSKLIFASHQPTKKQFPTRTTIPQPSLTRRPTFLLKKSPILKETQSPMQWKHHHSTLRPTRAPAVGTRYPSHMNLPTTNLQCIITANESCSLSSLHENENIRIFPSVDSGCGCIESYEQYSFVVTKGDPKNILIFFQGGGLCWDQKSLNHLKCRPYTLAPPEIGILDRTQPYDLNPFYNFTTVTIPYCTGDFFLGNATDNYFDSIGEPIRYKGLQNAKYILEWLRKEHETGGYLQNQSFDKLVLAGSSAGSIGVLAWSSQYSQALPAETTIVLADSLLIYSPPSYAPYLYDKWKFCSSFLLPPSLVTSCQLRQLHPVNILETIITSNPNINYYFISSKRDWTALELYNTILRSFSSTSSSALLSSPSSLSHSQRSSSHRHGPLSEDEYYKEIQSLLLNLIHRHHPSNLNFYLIDSFSHIYLNRQTLFTATPDSEQGITFNLTNGLALTEWLGFIASNHFNTLSLPKGFKRQSPSICRGDGCSTLFQAMNQD